MQFSAVYITSDLIIGGVRYTEGGLHRPPLNAVITSNTSPTVDYWTAVTPRPGEEYSVMELPTPSGHTGVVGGEYDPATTVPMRFIHVKLATHVYNKEHVFGWIDDVSVKVMKGQNKVIVVRWHVDWFLTMKGEVRYGAGRILRGPQSLARPDPTQPRLWVQDSSVRLGASNIGSCWVILTYVETDADKNITSIKSYFWQPSGTITYGGENYNCPGIDNVLMGRIEETLALSSGSIQGVWLSPIQPFNPSDVYVYREPPEPPAIGYGGAVYECIYPQSTYGEVVNVGAADVMTSDDEKYMISDITGSIYYTAPWGLPFKSIRMKVDVGTEGANLMLYFAESTDTDHDKGAEGRFVTIPLPGLPVTSNALSDYVYSGQREYDIRIREIQREQAAVNGIAGIGTSAIGGAVAGSMVAPGPGTVAGAIAGVVSGTVGTAVGYVSAGHYDKKTQEAVDKLMASQVNNIIMPAQGYAGLHPFSPFGWTLIKMVRDSVSAAEISNEHSELGYRTDSYSTNCTTLINSGGGLKIEGLVTYNVTPEASRYIEALFARGVHIDISSP